MNSLERSLRQRAAVSVMPAAAARPRVARAARLARDVLAVAVCAATVGALVGCSTASAPTSPTPPPSSPTALPTTPPGPQPSPVVGLLDPAPTDCAAVAPPRSFTSSDFGGGFVGPTTFLGGAPAWELGLGSPLHLNVLAGGATPYPATKVMWVVGPDYAHPVTLSGRAAGTGAPLWFEVYASDAAAAPVYTTEAVLDPAVPNRGSTQNGGGTWNIWGVGVVVVAAGCYELDVAWAGGSWRTVLAAGH